MSLLSPSQKSKLMNDLDTHIKIRDVADICKEYIVCDMSKTDKCLKCNHLLTNLTEEYMDSCDYEPEFDVIYCVCCCDYSEYGHEEYCYGHHKFCEGCESWHMICKECENFMQFLGHDGNVCIDGKEYDIIMSNRKLRENEYSYYEGYKCKKCTKLFDKSSPCNCYNISDNTDDTLIVNYLENLKLPYFTLYYLDINITGSDGGYSHYWKCVNNSCGQYNNIKSFTDK